VVYLYIFDLGPSLCCRACVLFAASRSKHSESLPFEGDNLQVLIVPGSRTWGWSFTLLAGQKMDEWG
jgi:hypothetical protein